MKRPVVLAVVAAILWPLITAGSCATTGGPQIKTQIVKVPVARSCVPASLGQEPAYPDTDAALKTTSGPDDMLHLLAAGRLLRDQWLKEVRPVLAGCRNPP